MEAVPDTVASGHPPDRTLIEALQAALQARLDEPVALIETHISWVLLAGDLAYKLKKPVRLPFVDFSTLESRRRCCELELQLNQRLAPQLYLSVLPVCGSAAAPRLGGPGAVIDHVVCMRRFAPGALLSEQLAAGRLQAVQVAQLAERLADFQHGAPVAAPEVPWGTPALIVQTVHDVIESLVPHVPADVLATLRGWLAEQSAALAPSWQARRAAGFVREGHGDLHLANAVQVGDEVLAFDCIEFDAALRWIDVANDLAFLTMDLAAHGRCDLAARALDAWLQRSGDFFALRVLRFYEAGRALVRALVAALRAQQVGAAAHATASASTSVAAGKAADAPPTHPATRPATEPDYLACAMQRVAPRPVPRLLITHGLSGCGKSTVALQLLAHTGAVRVRSDVERKRLLGLQALQRSADHRVDAYTPEATRRTFDRLAEAAREALRAGESVIVDAAFLRRAERQRFAALAAGLGVPFAILHCHAAEPVLRERVAARGAAGNDASEADGAVLQRQIADHDPLDADERALAIDVATDAAFDVASLAARWQGGDAACA